MRTLTLCVALWASVAIAADEPTVVSYHEQIKPILSANCVGCHQPSKKSGALDLTDYAALLSDETDSSTAAVVSGKPEESYLLELIAPDADGHAEMPKDAPPLPVTDVALIRAWIRSGAEDDSPPTTAIKFSADNPPTYSMPLAVTALALSPSGELLAVSGFHEVLVHNLPLGDGSRAPIARLVGISDRIESLSFSPDGKRLAVAGGSPSRLGEIQIWNVENIVAGSAELILSHPVTHDTVYGVSWSPNSRLVSFGCGDSTVRAIDAATGEQVLYQSAHDDWALDTVFSKDGSHIVSAGRDQTLKLIEVATERFVDNVTSITPGALSGGIQAIDRHPTRDEILVGSADGMPKIYKMHRTSARKIGDDANLLWELPALPGRIFAATFNGDGTRIACGSSLDGTGTIQVYEMPAEPEMPEEIQKLIDKPVPKRTQDETDKLKQHFAKNVTLLANISVPTSGIYSVVFSSDSNQVVAGGSDGLVRIYNVVDGNLLDEFTPVPLLEDLQSEETIAGNDLAQAPPSFRTDVMPVLAKLGCNAGTCHGSKDGKNGFKLSLRGYDPLGDHRALTDDLAGRRTNRAAPDQSLMLLKAVAAVPHEGGKRTDIDSEYYNIIRNWIAEGMVDDPEAAKVVRIDIAPQDPVVETSGETLQVELNATYSDGSTREVTSHAFYESSNTDVAAVTGSGLATAMRRGESSLLARYEGAYAATTLTVMGDRSTFDWKAPSQFSYIDELVDAKLKRVKTLPSRLCTDTQFVRRIYLDLTGLPPTPDQVRQFLEADQETQKKRDALISKLLESEEYIDHRTNKWCDMLQVNSKFLGGQGAKELRKWIREVVAANMPYDKFAEAIITASGSNRENPPAGYYKTLREPAALMENTTHLFLGVRFNCNKCHDHPFERWTQDQYYELAASFAQVSLKKDPESKGRQIGGTAVEKGKPLFEIVADSDKGEITHERTGDVTPPAFPYEHEYDCPEDATRRQRLAAWLVSPNNQYFARSYVNRIWGYLLGTGLIEPLDDIRAGNPPSNPELLNRLTLQFIDSGFDTRDLMRTICQSRTYQLSSDTNSWNEDDEINFSHAKLRRLPAEVLYDTVHMVVGATWNIPGVAAGTRASQLPDVQVKLPDLFLEQFGRPARESACECERSDNLMLGPVMALVNGPAISDAIVDPTNDLAKLEAEITDDHALVDELFLRILNRPPTDEEVTAAVASLQTPSDDRAVVMRNLEDLLVRSDRALPEWISQQKFVDWVAIRPEEVTNTFSQSITVQPDNSLLAGGEPGKGKYVVVLETMLPQIKGIKIEALADDRLPKKGPGLAPDGNFVLSELRVTAVPISDPVATEKVTLRNAKAIHSQSGYDVFKAIDGKPDTGWAIANQLGKNHAATFEFRGKVGFPEGTRLLVELDQQHNGDQHRLGKFRLSLTGDKPPLPVRNPDYPVDILALLRLPQDKFTERQHLVLRDYHRSLNTDITAAERAVNLVANPRLVGVQDLAWALINTPSFLFNR